MALAHEIDDRIREMAIDLMRRGEMMPVEISGLTGVVRQTIRLWAKTAGIDVMAARAEYVRRRWLKASQRATQED